MPITFKSNVGDTTDTAIGASQGSNYAWDPNKGQQADPTLTKSPPPGGINYQVPWGAFHGYSVSSVKEPAEKLMFADALWNVINIYGTGMTPAWNGGPTSDYDKTGEHVQASPSNPPIPGVGGYNALRTIAWRHNGGANVCFFDGHVAWLRKDQIYTVDPTAPNGKAPNWKLWNVMDSAYPYGPKLN